MNRGVNLNNVAEVKLFDVYGNCMGTAVPTLISVTLNGEISIECENLTTCLSASRPKIFGDIISDRLFYGLVSYGDMYTNKPDKKPIEKVIFNDPATIVFWADGSKTVVKCQEHEVYDPEKGLAMAIAKKAFGNEGNYYNIFKKWLPEKEDCATCDICINDASGITSNIEAMSNSIDAMAKIVKDIYGHGRGLQNE